MSDLDDDDFQSSVKPKRKSLRPSRAKAKPKTVPSQDVLSEDNDNDDPEDSDGSINFSRSTKKLSRPASRAKPTVTTKKPAEQNAKPRASKRSSTERLSVSKLSSLEVEVEGEGDYDDEDFSDFRSKVRRATNTTGSTQKHSNVENPLDYTAPVNISNDSFIQIASNDESVEIDHSDGDDDDAGMVICIFFIIIFYYYFLLLP
jgi:hypothetical protein